MTGRRHVGGLSETIDVYAGDTRLGSITKVGDQWVPVCAHPDLAGPDLEPRPWFKPQPSCGQRLTESRDPVTAKSTLIIHHGDQHDLDDDA